MERNSGGKWWVFICLCIPHPLEMGGVCSHQDEIGKLQGEEEVREGVVLFSLRGNVSRVYDHLNDPVLEVFN